ncbi:UNVERIFIED_CONTAM: hypothetical protein K2H54_009892 [Gekko kuhli]
MNKQHLQDTISENGRRRKAVKATLVLLPLLGITYMLFFVNPGEDDISQIFFIYFNSFLQSFQEAESYSAEVATFLTVGFGTLDSHFILPNVKLEGAPLNETSATF